MKNVGQPTLPDCPVFECIKVKADQNANQFFPDSFISRFDGSLMVLSTCLDRRIVCT